MADKGKSSIWNDLRSGASKGLDFYSTYRGINNARDNIAYSLDSINQGITGQYQNIAFSNIMSKKLLEEAAVNFQLGNFNRGLNLRAGRISVDSILVNTYGAVSQAKAQILHRGMQIAGSGTLIIDEITAQGMNLAREAIIDAEVKDLDLSYSNATAAERSHTEIKKLIAGQEASRHNVRDLRYQKSQVGRQVEGRVVQALQMSLNKMPGSIDAIFSSLIR